MVETRKADDLNRWIHYKNQKTLWPNGLRIMFNTTEYIAYIQNKDVVVICSSSTKINCTFAWFFLFFSMPSVCHNQFAVVQSGLIFQIKMTNTHFLMIYWAKPPMDPFAFVSELTKTQKAAPWLVVKRTWLTAWIELRLSTNPITICLTNLSIHQYIMIKMPVPAKHLTIMQ